MEAAWYRFLPRPSVPLCCEKARGTFLFFSSLLLPWCPAVGVGQVGVELAEAAADLLRPHVPLVVELLRECLDADDAKRPCSAEVLDRLCAILFDTPLRTPNPRSTPVPPPPRRLAPDSTLSCVLCCVFCRVLPLLCACFCVCAVPPVCLACACCALTVCLLYACMLYLRFALSCPTPPPPWGTAMVGCTPCCGCLPTNHELILRVICVCVNVRGNACTCVCFLCACVCLYVPMCPLYACVCGWHCVPACCSLSSAWGSPLGGRPVEPVLACRRRCRVAATFRRHSGAAGGQARP